MSSHLLRAIEGLIEDEVERRLAVQARGSRPPLTVGEFAVQARLTYSTVYGLIRKQKIRVVG